MTGNETVTTSGEGAAMMDLVRDLYPICRSITGNGVRQTLDRVAEHIPLARHEIPSGTQVFDWQIPREWNVREAYLATVDGRREVDFADHNLHLLNYSVPVRRRVARDELLEHVFTLPEHPGWIPYRTSYYRDNWGFCMAHDTLATLGDPEYDVVIDTTLEPGALTLAECVLEGESDQEILLSTHICHPSLCNDNLSGIAVLTWLMAWLARRERRLTYRAVFVPGTIGSLAWLHLRQQQLDRIRGGLVLSGLGDAGGFTYKRSRQSRSPMDRLLQVALRDGTEPWQVRDFSPYGYDERQYCSPGFNLAVGRLSRTPYGEYPEYHTSADDLSLVSAPSLEGALGCCQRIVSYLEADRRWVNTKPHGEPQLGKYGLYGSIGGTSADQQRLALLWMLNLSDGSHSLLDIAERSALDMGLLAEAAERLATAGLLRPAPAAGPDTDTATRG